MLRSFRKLNLLVLAVAVSLLTACAGGTDVSRFIAQPNEPHGQVITSVDLPGQYLYAVQVYKVDGQEIPRRRGAVWLKPGRHEINAVSDGSVNRGFVPGLRIDRSFPSGKPLVLDVEAGKIYYVALKADDSRRENWELVVWKVEDQA